MKAFGDADFFDVENIATFYGGHFQDSPLKGSIPDKNFVQDGRDRILVDISLKGLLSAPRPAEGRIVFAPPTFEVAGPREKIYWQPENTKIAIVTCGGLAPGLNNVLQSIVNVLHDRYGVKNIYGVPYGYYGFYHDPDTKKFRFGWRRLDPVSVQNIDAEAGSILGTSRGNSNVNMIVDALAMRDINILFTVGGDGTLAGANAIYNEIKKRKLPIAVVGIPKTIDNDILWVSKSFGFETAVEKAVEALRSAQTEARSGLNGVGLVKLMGRHSGLITATAAAGLSGVDFVLVPEVKLVLDGPDGFLNVLLQRVIEKGHATIVVAEGAGQNLFSDAEKKYDASGNLALNNIGRFLQERIPRFFKEQKQECSLKYIDPSYILRAQCTTASDSLFCASLGQNAVHAAMAGKTGLMVGYAHGEFTHVPLAALGLAKKGLDTSSPLWLSVLASTGQPSQWQNVSET